MHRKHFLLLFLALFLAAFAAVPARVQAAARPKNDDFSRATVITALPFSDSEDVSAATTQPGEPSPACLSSLADSPHTVWYSFTPQSDMGISPNTSPGGGQGGVRFDYAVYLQTGSGFAGLQLLNCNDNYRWNYGYFHLDGGKTYLFQIHATRNQSPYPLTFTVNPIAAPANDDFATATPLALPYSDAGTLLVGASVQAGEPGPSCGPSGPSRWYSITPATTAPIYFAAGYQTTLVPNVIAAYTGSSLSSLTQIGCDYDAGSWRGFHYVEIAPRAGTTYYFQVSGGSWEWGPVDLSADVVPLPSAGFTFTPPDPSIYDSVQFTDASWDPWGLGITSQSWTFGDGASATGSPAAHTYRKDGDYTVTVTVTTPDTRVASASQTVSIRTHDVEVESLSVPQNAVSGQTRNITAAIGNDRYPEQVSVDLYRSNAYGGFDYVTTLVQPVPVQDTPTNFTFAYTFTTDDAAPGSVYFQAVAKIQGYRDARPANNVAVAGPTNVPR